MKHTPGPWRVGSGKFYMDYRAIGACIVSGDDAEPFVSIKKSQHSEADARLIVAAPQLLAAAQELLSVLSVVYALFPSASQGPASVTDHVAWATVRAKSAIAKATGETQEVTV